MVEVSTLLDQSLYAEVVRYFRQRWDQPAERVEQQVIECLRYLYLVSAYPERLGGLFLPVEQPVDEIWHYLILQTREYRELCESRLPGRRFIDHRSLPYEEYGRLPPREQMIEQSLRWLPLYRDTFGAFTEHALPHWTMARFLHDELHLSLTDIARLDAGQGPA